MGLELQTVMSHHVGVGIEPRVQQSVFLTAEPQDSSTKCKMLVFQGGCVPWLWLPLLYYGRHQVQQASEVKWSLQLTNVYLLNKAINLSVFSGDFLFCFV